MSYLYDFSLLIVFFLSFKTFASNPLQNKFENKNNSSIRFTENKGQVYNQYYNSRTDILYYGRNGTMNFFIGKNTLHYQLYKEDHSCKNYSSVHYDKFEEPIYSSQFEIYRVDVQWLNSNQNFLIVPEGELSDYENFYLFPCPDGVLYVKGYSKLAYKDFYNGIDLLFLDRDNVLNYDFLVKAGYDYRQIKMKIEGAESIEKDNEGNIIIHTPLGRIIEEKPKAFQNDKVLDIDWVLNENIISFEIKDADINAPLLIDPPIRTWGTYHPGERGYDCVADKEGNVYLTGYTKFSSLVNLATTGSHQTSYGGEATDGFISKFDSVGNRLWATYYGGSGIDISNSCAVDSNNNVFITGETWSNTAIATSGAFQSNLIGSINAFLVKFNKNGVRIWGTYFGGAVTQGYSCKVSKSGNVHIAGVTQSTSRIASIASYQSIHGGGYDAFLVKFSGNGSRLWGTYYGGEKGDWCYSSAVDSDENIFITGRTLSTTKIVSPNCFQQSLNSGDDGFLAKFNKDGNRIWSTYYGGNNNEFIYACATDSQNDVFIGGSSGSDSLVTTTGSHQHNLASSGISDALLAKFDKNGNRLWSTFYGGNKTETIRNIVTDRNNNVYICGTTESNNRIATQGAFNTNFCCNGASSSFLAKFNPFGRLEWGTYYGGATSNGGRNEAYSCTVDLLGNIYLSGATASISGIATPNAFQPTFGGGNYNQNPYIAKFLCSPSEPFSSIIGNDTVCYNTDEIEFYTNYAGISYNWTVPNGVSIISGQGTNRILVNLNGNSGSIAINAQEACGTSFDQTIQVYIDSSKPNAIVTLSSDTICSGSAATFSIIGGLNYIWSTGDTSSTITVNPISNSTYYLTVSENACDTTIILKVGVIQPDTSVRQLGDTLISNADNVTYQWLNCNSDLPLINDTGKIFIASLNGSYAVIINEKGCTDTSSCFNINLLSGVDEYSGTHTRLFPNPVKNFLNIQLDKIYSNFTINIYDLSGKLVMQNNFTYTNKAMINFDVSDGFYFVSIVSKETNQIFKVFKE